MEIKYIIPARAGSKGFPGKNRRLFYYTAQTIPKEHTLDVIVSTDDPEIKSMAKDEGFIVHQRSDYLGGDTISTKEVCEEIIYYEYGRYITQTQADDTFIILPLTYPTRTWNEIETISEHFKKQMSGSLLCKQKPKTHPYLCIYPDGKQVIKHGLYRRQDYPVIYEISHYVSMFRLGEFRKLNLNLYNENTCWYYIENVIDVDSMEELKKIEDNDGDIT